MLEVTKCECVVLNKSKKPTMVHASAFKWTGLPLQSSNGVEVGPGNEHPEGDWGTMRVCERSGNKLECTATVNSAA
jgi:hypothetical protein